MDLEVAEEGGKGIKHCLMGNELEIKICGMKVLMLSSEDWAEWSRYISALFC